MRAAENDSHAMIESFREPAPVVVESRQEFPRFSHFTEDEPMKIVPKSRSRIMDDEEDNYPPMNTNEPSMDDDSQQRQELPIEPTPKVAKPKGNPFAKSKVDASALKKIIKVGIVEDEPEKKKRRTNITDFVIRASVY